MTYKELLDSVSFEEIVPYIEKYHGEKGCLALYKTHYDMLRHLTPNPEDAYYKTATVSHGEQDEDWPEPHLTVNPIEGQIWAGALTMELVELVGVISLVSSYFQYCNRSSRKGLLLMNTPTTEATVS